MIRSNPDTVFDIRTLDKKTILEWMNLRTFSEPNCCYYYNNKQSHYSDLVQIVRNIQEKTIKLKAREYNDRKHEISHKLYSSKSDVQLTEAVFDDENYTITTRLTQAGVLFKEWSSDLT
jgi:hypothetical protein